jgi:ubiquinone/menaquinone biosynthesis C-methylase UbiE
MNMSLTEMIQTWRLEPGSDPGVQIAAMLESLQAAGLLRASANSVLLGEQYHPGGAEDTRRMAGLLEISEADHVLDLACYVGGPARQLAREYGCQVVGVDISQDCIAIAERLTQLCGLSDKARFVCSSADAVPFPDASFTVAWSQCSFPSDLSWVNEMDRLLAPGGRLGFTGLIRREKAEDVTLLTLAEMAARMRAMRYSIVCAEDISDCELEYHWFPIRQKLEDNEAYYRDLLGAEWVGRARRDLDADTAAWRERRMGNGRIVAVKE